MSLLGNILSTGASFIPGAGPFIAAGIGIVDKVVDGKKQAKADEHAQFMAKVNARQVPSVPDATSIMYGGGEKEISTETSVLGKTTYLSEKFGIGKGLFGQGNLITQ